MFYALSVSLKNAGMAIGTMGNRQILYEEADFRTDDGNYPL